MNFNHLRYRVWKLEFLVTAICLCILLTACAANPIKEAQTLDQKAFASYGQFVIYEELAANLVQDPNVPQAAKLALRSADAVAKPIADRGLDVIRVYDRVAAEVAAGTSSADKLAIATADLQSWIEQATPAVKGLVTAVKQVHK